MAQIRQPTPQLTAEAFLTESLRQKERGRDVGYILSAALRAVDPYEAVLRHMHRRGERLTIGEVVTNLESIERVFVVGFGKAGEPMARAVVEVLGDRLAGGCVIIKEGTRSKSASPLEGTIEFIEAGHPIPNERGVHGATRIQALLEGTQPNDLMICLISGGGSALSVAPAPGIHLEELQTLTRLLLASGADIYAINTLRKHLELLKGGGLARMAFPAKVASLILSDVVGDPLEAIASGPTAPDPTTFQQAYGILERYGLIAHTPRAILQHLQEGMRGTILETPKPGDPLFDRVHNVIIANNSVAVHAARSAARQKGFKSAVLTTFLQGEARQVGRVLAATLRQIVASGEPLSRPACLIAGGETTVTLQGKGLGGRNQEMALSAALDLAGLRDVALITLATDGGDGPTDTAGAVVTGETLSRAQALGMEAQVYLEDNNAYSFFARLGDLIHTGATQTNVNDLVFLFAF